MGATSGGSCCPQLLSQLQEVGGGCLRRPKLVGAHAPRRAGSGGSGLSPPRPRPPCPASLPKISGTKWARLLAGEGSPGSQIAGGGGVDARECEVRVSLGCVQCLHVGILRFQRSGRGGVAYTRWGQSLVSPEAGAGLGPSALAEATGLGPARAGSPRGARAPRVRRPPPAERPRWETRSERFAPYLPSVRPILFSALKTDMSNWQLVPNRVQRSLVEHFYSCLLQLDAYSCRLNEKQNVL